MQRDNWTPERMNKKQWIPQLWYSNAALLAQDRILASMDPSDILLFLKKPWLRCCLLSWTWQHCLLHLKPSALTACHHQQQNLEDRVLSLTELAASSVKLLVSLNSLPAATPIPSSSINQPDEKDQIQKRKRRQNDHNASLP